MRLGEVQTPFVFIHPLLRITSTPPDNLERSGKLLRVLAFVTRNLHHRWHAKIQPKSSQNPAKIVH